MPFSLVYQITEFSYMIGSIPMLHQNVITAIKLNILVKRMAYMITLKPAHIIEHTHISGIDYQSKLRLVIKAVFCSIPCTCCMKYKGIAVFNFIDLTIYFNIFVF